MRGFGRSWPAAVPARRGRRQWVLLLSLLAALAYAANRWLPRAGSGAAPADSAQVLEVTDGDSLRVMYRGDQTRVRLLRINTPERGQPGSRQATQALRDLVQSAAVTLEFEQPGKEEHDSYGRLLAYVFARDKNVNVELVRLGWTRFWTRYGEGRYAAEFAAAEREARQARRGIWALEGE